MTRAVMIALAAVALAGCPGNKVGTIALGLTTAPGSTLMDRVARLQLTFTNPRQVLVVDRTERGFDLALELDADGEVGALAVDGLDANGALVATGMTPPFPLAAIDARIVVYMAAPMSVGPAPVSLAPARSRVSAAALGYGAVLAGGVDQADGASDAIQIYNAYDHTLVTGLPMPAPRTGVTLAVTAVNGVYLFGGSDPAGAPTGTLWFFDTTIAPSGRYSQISDLPQFARTGRAAVPVGGDSYLIAGAPPITLAAAQIAEPSGIPALSSGASLIGSDRVVITVMVDDATGELIRIRGGSGQPLDAQRKNGLAIALPERSGAETGSLGSPPRGRRIAVVGGDAAPRDAIVVDIDTDELAPVPGALAEAYATLAVAATPRFVVVAGGRAGGGGTAIEVLDTATLERRHVASVDDEITAAVALPNEQVLLIGATLQLFTPPPPE